ncbi:hypothetical protein BMG_3738 [Priestia megaterium]|nr:hypothetical protein BMG_3738 [Priestia megaterium]
MQLVQKKQKVCIIKNKAVFLVILGKRLYFGSNKKLNNILIQNYTV